MTAKRDIGNLEDVKMLVDDFYGQIREDDLLADIFNDVIQDRWPEHLEKMYSFWQTVLLDDERTYNGRPFVPHAYLPVEGMHFERWLELWFGTVNEYFNGPRADVAKWQANRMAEMFLTKIEYLRENIQPLN